MEALRVRLKRRFAHCTITILMKNPAWQEYSKLFRSSYAEICKQTNVNNKCKQKNVNKQLTTYVVVAVSFDVFFHSWVGIDQVDPVPVVVVADLRGEVARNWFGILPQPLRPQMQRPPNYLKYRELLRPNRVLLGHHRAINISFCVLFPKKK